jgi:hypothetical protein
VAGLGRYYSLHACMPVTDSTRTRGAVEDVRVGDHLAESQLAIARVVCCRHLVERLQFVGTNIHVVYLCTTAHCIRCHSLKYLARQQQQQQQQRKQRQRSTQLCCSHIVEKQYLHASVLVLARVQQMEHRRKLVRIQMVVTAGEATASKRQQPDHDGVADT